MDVRNCRTCGKLFNYLSGPPICPTCANALDKKFEMVKEYIYDHPRVGIKEVSEECEVSVAQITQWIREERLTFAEDLMIGLDCEGCGVTIRTGDFARHVKIGLQKDLKVYILKKTAIKSPQILRIVQGCAISDQK